MIDNITQFLTKNGNLIVFTTYGLALLASVIVIVYSNIKEVFKKVYLPFFLFWFLISVLVVESVQKIVLMLISIFPLAVLIGFSFKLIFSTYDTYLKNRSHITRQLLLYFIALTVFMSYSLFFVLYSYFTDFNLDTDIIRFFGLNLLIIWVLLLISSFYTSKAIFFPDNTSSKYVEFFLVFLSGAMLGRMLSLSNLTLLDFSYYGVEFEIINILSDYNILLAFILMFTLVFFYNLYYSIKTYYKINKLFSEKNVKIDPVTIPRLKLAVYSNIFFLLLNFSIFIVIITNNLYISLAFYGLFVLSLLVLEVTLYLAFQTPASIKQKWRRKYMNKMVLV